MAALRVLLATGFVALPLWLAVHTPGHACTCGMTTLGEQVAAAQIIAVATVESIDRPPPTPGPSTYPPDTVTIAVSEYIKGSGPPTLTYESPSPLIAACQFFVDPGDEGVFFLSSAGEGNLSTSTCSGSASADAEYIAQIRALLQEPTATSLPPTATSPPPPPSPTFMLPPTGTGAGSSGEVSWSLIGVAAAGALLASTALLALRARR